MLLKLILQCVIGLGVGIYGYLVPSYINLAVLQLGLDKNKKAIWKTLIIVSLIEIPYCYLCMNAMQWIMQQHTFLLVIKWVLVLMLVLFAIFTLRHAHKSDSTSSEEKHLKDKNNIPSKNSTNKLLLFAIFNPFQLSAWTIWGTYFIEKSWFIWTPFSILLFSVGASVGVFIILFAYAFTGQKLVSYFSLNRKSIDYVVAGILLLLAIIQVIRNLES